MPAVRPFPVRLGATVAALGLALVGVACGDDDTETSAEHQEYCDFVEELDSQDDLPSEEQFAELRELTPDEISEETDYVIDAFVEADGDVSKVFADPKVEEYFGVMEEHDAKVCGFEPPEEEEEPDTEAAEGAQVVPVTAVDFGFEGIPAEVPAGPVAFELSNQGEAAHEMVIFQLGEGVNLDELLASEEEPSEDEAREVGGTFTEPGGDATFANVELEAGDYAVVCFIPGPEGKPHHELGMQTTFTVG